MNFLRRFLNVVPRAVWPWALILGACMFLIALVAGYNTANHGEMFPFGAAGLVFGLIAAIWCLCLGFVYADARRRAMRSVLWVLVAGLFPHLLGFLLYFVLRQPIAAVCPHCGKTVSSYQRFCSWCGASLIPADPTSTPFTANPSQGATQ